MGGVGPGPAAGGAILGDLGQDQVDLKLLARRLAQLEVQLARIADSQELSLKLACLTANIPLKALREATEVDAEPGVTDVTTQTPEEIEELDAAHERLERQFGKGRVPASLDLYAEVEAHRAGRVDEDPEAGA